MESIRTHNLIKTYFIGNKEVSVLDDVSLSIKSGEFLVISGKSGSGKTTLLTLLSGLDKPTSGKIFINNHDITHLSEDALAPFRNRFFGFVFQSYYLIPSLTALENVTFPAELNGQKNFREKAKQLLSRVGLTHRGSSYPHQLSGGEKQRIAICRALINSPQIIFADEPTGNLDSQNGQGILNILLELKNSENTTLILVTHNHEIAQSADRIIDLADGKIDQ